MDFLRRGEAGRKATSNDDLPTDFATAVGCGMNIEIKIARQQLGDQRGG